MDTTGRRTLEGDHRARDAAYIASHLDEFGLRWVYRDLNKGRDQKTLLRRDVPQLEMVETEDGLQKCFRHFPAVVYASMNGTSAKVRSQNVSRPFLRANMRATDEQIQEHVVRSVLLNQVSRSGGSRPVYIGPDGRTYATLGEAQAAVKSAPSMPSPVELAQAFIADAVDMGVSYNIARERALAKWPEAFTGPSPHDGDDGDGQAESGTSLADSITDDYDYDGDDYDDTVRPG